MDPPPSVVTKDDAVASTDITLHLSFDYVKKPAGILRLIEISYSFICLVASGVALAPLDTMIRVAPGSPNIGYLIGLHGGAGFFMCVSATSLLCTLILLFVHVTKLVEPRKRLLMADTVFCCAWAVLFFIGSVTVAVFTKYPVPENSVCLLCYIFGAQVATCLFGFLTFAAMTVHVYFLVGELRQAE